MAVQLSNETVGYEKKTQSNQNRGLRIKTKSQKTYILTKPHTNILSPPKPG